MSRTLRWAEISPQEAEILYREGREFYRMVLNEGPLWLRQRMQHPLAGDLVIEVSRFGNRSFDPDSTGWLLRTEGKLFDERVIVEPLYRPGVEQGWANSTWVAIPVFLNKKASA